MRANEFIGERKRKKSKKYGGYFYPGFAYFGGSSDTGDAGMGDGGGECVYEKTKSKKPKPDTYK